MRLSDEYRKLSDLFDQVLSLSRMIVSELEMGGTEESLINLLNKKEATGMEIQKLAHKITTPEIGSNSQSNLKILAEIKPILKQIERKASLLQTVERKIQELVKRKKKQ